MFKKLIRYFKQTILLYNKTVPNAYPRAFNGELTGMFFHRINYTKIRKDRQCKVRLMNTSINNSQKNRQIRSIKTANHIAKGIHYKDCPDAC